MALEPAVPEFRSSVAKNKHRAYHKTHDNSDTLSFHRPLTTHLLLFHRPFSFNNYACFVADP